jgi:hypothetical protein
MNNTNTLTEYQAVDIGRENLRANTLDWPDIEDDERN